MAKRYGRPSAQYRYEHYDPRTWRRVARHRGTLARQAGVPFPSNGRPGPGRPFAIPGG